MVRVWFSYSNKIVSKSCKGKGNFSQKGWWKYTLFQFFLIFSSRFFKRACDWLRIEIWIQIHQITSSVKKFRGKIDEKLEKCIFSYTFLKKTLPLLGGILKLRWPTFSTFWPPTYLWLTLLLNRAYYYS